MPTLFFDESGYTGPDLLETKTPFYACSSLHLTEARAAELKRLHFPDKSAELKFSDMKSGRNFYRVRDLIGTLLKERAVRVFVIDKRFALSAKLFEWIAEPALSEQGDLYSDGFLPKLVNIFHSRAMQEQPQQLLGVHRAYQEAVKTPEAQPIQALIDALGALDGLPGESARAYLLPPLEQDGAALFEDYGITEGLNGILLSAAWQNLLRWGAHFAPGTPLEVVYDDHTVMQKETALWNLATAASLSMQANGRAFRIQHPVTTRPGASKTEIAIQLADIVAGFAAFAVQTHRKFIDLPQPSHPVPGLLAYELLHDPEFASEQPLITMEAGTPERFSGWTIEGMPQ